MPDPKLLKLEQILKMLDDGMTKQDFVKAFEKVLEFVVKSKKEQDAFLEKLTALHDTMMSKMEREHLTGMTGMKNEVMKMCDEHIKHLTGMTGMKMKEMDKKMTEMQNGLDGEDGKDADPKMVADMVLSKIIIPDVTPLKKEIDDLKEMIKKMKKSYGKTIFVGGNGGATGGGIVKVYDLSAQLDGVTKTFALPAFWRVLTADLSSFPNALRPTVDFTTDGAAMTITFTSAIDAASSLATGQTCIITYAEA